MAEREPIAWLLNLEAEHELEARGTYAPTRHVERIVARERRRLLGGLVAPGDVLVEGPGLAAARGLRGIAWSPTPGALRRLAAAGATGPEAPSLEVLRRVNARPFTVSLRAPLAHDSLEKVVVSHLEEALERLARPAELGWLVRRSYGAAGRGRRRIAAGEPSKEERAWLAAGLRTGDLVIEPWVRVTREFTRCGFVGRDGSVEVLAPGLQTTDEHGAWMQTTPAGAGDVAGEDDRRLEQAVGRAGAALAEAGYFGPFGIDAFRHRRPGQTGDVLNPISEINARLTMDWPSSGRAVELLLGSR